MIVIFYFREEPIDYGVLDTSLRNTCKKMGLQDIGGNYNCAIFL